MKNKVICTQCKKEFFAPKYLKRKFCDANCANLGNRGKENPRYNHGMAGTKIYKIWASMKQRCRNKNDHDYKDYGERGIDFSDRWENFETFFKDMGFPQKGLTLERNNVNGNYCKENCRWATRKDQSKNRRPCKNSTGFTGVYKDGKSFHSLLKSNGLIYKSGYRKTPEEALDWFLTKYKELNKKLPNQFYVDGSLMKVFYGQQS
jgi:hypothetical protein